MHHRSGILSSFLLPVAALVLVGCPPLPERHARDYLTRHGFSSCVVAAVIEGTQLSHEEFSTLLAVSDVSVRHMVARNPHLGLRERSICLQDANEYVRSGVAMNPRLTEEETRLLMHDPSPVVVGNMALNPSLSADVLLFLRAHRQVPLSSLAQNPNCPESVIQEIEQSDDSLAKQLLDITREKRRANLE